MDTQHIHKRLQVSVSGDEEEFGVSLQMKKDDTSHFLLGFFFFFFLKLAIEFLFEQIASQRNCDNFLQLRGLPTLGFMWSLSCVICLWRNAIFRANFKFFYHKAVVVSNTGSACVKRRIVIITTLKKPHNSIFSGSKISLK